MFDTKKAAEAQMRLSTKLKLKWEARKLNTLAGADCSYISGRRKIGAVIVIYKIPEFEIVEIVEEIRDVRIPYIPGFLNFREAPVFFKAYEKVRNKPDVTLIDGNGIAHPRRMGLASYIGVILDISTVGCAKRPFFPFRQPEVERGSYSVLRNDAKVKVGLCLRTRTGVNPVFVSPGHKIDFEASKKIVLSCSSFRIPEPLREAHRLASRLFK